MSFMSSLPESKRLEKLKIDHLEYMAKLRFEQERLEQEAANSAIKEKIAAEKEAHERALAHEKWLADQKRAIQALRVQQALAREMPVGDPTANSSSAISHYKMQYDVNQGFKLFCDYGIHFPRKLKRLDLARTRIVHCIYNGDRMFSAKPKQSKFYDSEKSANGQTQTVFGFAKAYPKTSPLVTMHLILQIDYTPEADGMANKPLTKTLGWCSFPLFHEVEESETPKLRVGNFKVTLNPGAFNASFLRMKNEETPDVSEEALQKPTMFLRVRHNGKPTEQFSIEPTMTQHMYKWPQEKDEEPEEEKVETKNKKKKKPIKKRQHVDKAHDHDNDEKLKHSAEKGPEGGDEDQHGGEHDAGEAEPEEEDEDNEEDVEKPVEHDFFVSFHRLEILPHAHLEKKPNISIQVETVTEGGGEGEEEEETKYETVFTTKPAKGKSSEHSLTYSLKRQATEVKSSATVTSLRVSAVPAGADGPLFSGTVKLIDAHGNPIHGE